MWHRPLNKELIETSDSFSFKDFKPNQTGLPLAPHPGAFGVQRKNHVHEGVDLYAPAGTLVYAVEPGRVVKVTNFTGPAAGLPWWAPTWAVWVEGASGVVLYGELASFVTEGQSVIAGQPIGAIQQVLRKDKGRPMAMLHLELHEPGSREAPQWLDASDKPRVLRDPTEFLIQLCKGKHDHPEGNCHSISGA